MEENTQIKPFKKVSVIYCFNGDKITTDIELDTLFKAINSGTKFIRLMDNIINVSDIKRIALDEIDEIENYVLGIKDVKKREKLQQIIKDRKEKRFRIKNIEHLEEIYKNNLGK